MSFDPAHRYVLVGGVFFQTTRGDAAFTGLRVVGSYATLAEGHIAVDKAFDECGGLTLLLDTETGEPA